MRFVEISEHKHEELLHLVKKMKKMACIVEKCLESDDDTEYRRHDKDMEDDDEDMDVQYRRGSRSRSMGRRY